MEWKYLFPVRVLSWIILYNFSVEKKRVFDVMLLTYFRDMPDKMTRSEVETLFRLNDICLTCGHPITTVDVSASTGQGLGEIIKWLDQNAFGKGWTVLSFEDLVSFPCVHIMIMTVINVIIWVVSLVSDSYKNELAPFIIKMDLYTTTNNGGRGSF